jgi:drug/metabolite transporter (DMT)-like permease
VSGSTTAARREREGVLLLVIACFGFAWMVIGAKLAFDHGANVVTLLGVRFTIGGTLLWALAARRGVVRGPARRDVLLALALGAFYCLETSFVFTALDRMDASFVELLIFTYPALVVFASIALRRESPSLRRFAALAIASFGVVLVLAGNTSGGLDPLASVLTLIGAVLYAVYVVLAEPVSRRMNSLTLAAFVCTGAAFMFMAYGSVRGSLTLGMGFAGWSWTTTVAVSSTVIALAAYLAGVERLGASRASILATLEPAIACVLAFLVFGDRLTPLQLLGGAFVVSAGLVLQLRPVRSRRRDAAAHTAAGAPAGPLAREPA